MLESAIFREAKADIEGRLKRLRGDVAISDTEKHTRIILLEQLWHQLESYFEQLAQTGKFIEQRLGEEERQRTLIEQGLALFRKGGRAAI